MSQAPISSSKLTNTQTAKPSVASPMSASGTTQPIASQNQIRPLVVEALASPTSTPLVSVSLVSYGLGWSVIDELDVRIVAA